MRIICLMLILISSITVYSQESYQFKYWVQYEYNPLKKDFDVSYYKWNTTVTINRDSIIVKPSNYKVDSVLIREKTEIDDFGNIVYYCRTKNKHVILTVEGTKVIYIDVADSWDEDLQLYRNKMQMLNE